MIPSTLLAAALLMLAPAANPPEARLGLGAQPEFGAGGEIRVPVVLAAPREDGVAALQFDLAFDTAQLAFMSVEAGPSSVAAEKLAQANPLRAGTARVIIAGLNRNALADGIVAWAHFSPAPGAHPPFKLGLGGTVFSDPSGNAIDVETSPDTLTLDPAANVALASDTGAGNDSPSGMEMLIRYRALVFASILVGGTLLLARRAPRKGRIR